MLLVDSFGNSMNSDVSFSSLESFELAALFLSCVKNEDNSYLVVIIFKFSFFTAESFVELKYAS